MIFDKEKVLNLKDYLEIRKPQYIYVKITPHKSTRNYNSNSIAKAIAGTYKSINKRIKREQGKLIIESSFKISYIIDIQGNNANFYFLVPKLFLNTILEKIKEVWSKATVEVMEEGIKEFGSNAVAYSLSYKKEDALSLDVDRKSNEPLNSILSVMEVMQEGDRVTVIYNFMPSTQASWKEQYKTTMDNITAKKSIDKKVMSFDYIFRNTVVALLGVLEGLMNVIGDFVGADSTGTQESLYTSIMGVLERQDELSIATKKKKEATVIETQILIVGEGTGAEANVINTCQAYSSIDGDNELTYKKVKLNKKKKLAATYYDFEVDKCIFSADEVGNFLQVPGRVLLNQFGIKHIKVEESKVPIELQNGIKSLGNAKFKGSTTTAYLENDYNNGNLPLVLIGSQGGGKTTYIKHYAEDCIKNNEGIVVIDFIKKCELSEAIKKVTPASKLIEIDLSNSKEIQGLGYNEIVINRDMEVFEKLDLASMQSKQVISLVDSISVGDPLTSRMRRFLNSAATIVFVQGFNSVKNVLECLESYQKRAEYIKGLTEEERGQLEEEIRTLEELNDKNKQGEVVGTRESKIEHIIDRVSMLREDFKLKYMYNKSLENNINLVQAMNEGKVVLFKMKESSFSTKMIKNIMVTYLISKVWLASQIRGSQTEKPLRSNIIVDEVFQAPTCMQNLEYILPQCRKFGTKFIFSTQYIKQLDTIGDTLEASGSSYMMLTGSTEHDFNTFKNKLVNYEYDDLLNLEEFHSLNLIKYSKGYASFITKLPYRLA